MDRKLNLNVTDIILFAGTRVALGVGLGLLLSRRLNRDQIQGAGVALAVIGGLTTIPLAIGVLKKQDVPQTGLRSVA